LGVVSGLLGRWQDAALAFSRVVFGGSGEAQAGPMGYYPEALQFLGRLLQLAPEPGSLRAELLLSRPGLASSESKLETLKLAVADNPGDLAAHFELGETYMSLGRYAEAVAAYRAAVQLNPQEARGHYHLAVAYRAMGDLVAAVEEYSIVRTLDEALARQLFA
jgi:tetratricopeptide (TPR) repeat protein